MRIPHSSAIRRELGVSMTPMIDVVFLLLIFFVCTASFQVAEAILPSPIAMEGDSAEVLPPELLEPELERLLIQITQPNGELQLALNGRPCPSVERLSELLLALAKVDATLPLILDIGGEVPLGTAIDVYDRCRLAKFQKIQFAVEALR